MKHTFSIDTVRRIIILRYLGKTTVQDMKNISIDVWADPSYNQFFNGILDYRKAELDTSVEGIDEIADYFLEASEASFGNAAIIAARPLETALTMIFAHRMLSRNKIHIFSTWEAACKFVGVEDLPEPSPLIVDC